MIDIALGDGAVAEALNAWFMGGLLSINFEVQQ